MAPTCDDEKQLDSVSTVLFDLDNTLISTRKADQAATEEVFAHLCFCGVPESWAKQVVEKFYQCLRINPEDPVKGRTDLDTWRTLLWAYALGPTYAHLARDVFPMWKSTRLANIDFNTETLEFLEALRSNYKLGLITNGSSEAQWEKIKHLGANDMFDVILVGGDHAEQKPAASIFEKAFRTLDVQPHECIMVGDMLNTDIQGGINAGVAATVWIPLQECENPDPKPDYVFKNLGELLPILGVGSGS